MSAETTVNPRGIFNRAAKGKRVEPVTVQAERGRITFFAQVLEYDDPIHFDVDAARAAGHPDLVAPPSFFMVLESLANEEMRRKRIPTALSLLNADFRYLLHGDERYFYDAPIYAGEDVQYRSIVVDFYDKKGGAMEFATIEASILSPTRGSLVRCQRTLLHRLPPLKG